MGWRSILIACPARIQVKNRQIRVETEKGEATFPLEDAESLVLDSPQVFLSSALLSELAENGIALHVCGRTHLPNGVLVPYSGHFRQAGIADRQLGISEPQRRRLWREIVRRKIENQAECLNLLGKNGGDRIRKMSAIVKSGDPDNLEGTAAGFYFSSLFGEDFSRRREDKTNALLNYGYAIVRGALARSVAAQGLLPMFGIFHRSERNPFNLVDDLIEPYRPVVDLIVCSEEWEDDEDLRPSEKKRLVEILHRDVRINGERRTVSASIEFFLDSLVAYFEHGDPSRVLLPEIVMSSPREME